jgi:hypothetical protein
MTASIAASSAPSSGFFASLSAIALSLSFVKLALGNNTLSLPITLFLQQ